MNLQELTEKKDLLLEVLAQEKEPEMIAKYEAKIAKLDAQIAELEAPAPAPAGKESAKAKAPRPPKEPKAKKEVEEGDATTMSFATDTAEQEEDARLDKKFAKDEKVLDCETVIKDFREMKKAHDDKWKEQNLIDRIMRSKEHKGKHTRKELEDKTVPELRQMLGLVKPPQEKMEDDVERTFEGYTKKRLAIVLKDLAPEKVNAKKAEIAALEKEYAQKIAKDFAKYRQEFLKRVEAL